MVNCSFCGKEIKRLVFCSPSHKVMYHRADSIKNPLNKTIKKIQKEKAVEVCKHGRMLGLCEYGCR